MLHTNLRLPLFRAVEFENLNCNAKKSATVSVRLTFGVTDVLYTQSKTRSIIGFQDPNTGLFVTNLRVVDNPTISVYNLFRQQAVDYAQQAVTEKITQLQTEFKQDPGKYNAQYKSLTVINQELTHYLEDKINFFFDLDRQISLIHSVARPQVNEYLAFHDDELNNQHFVTTKLPYLNPAHQVLSDADRKLVEAFLNVFVDADNRDILSWYFGAMLLNLPIYDDRISKMMIVSSARGGSGKSTLIQTLADALLTTDFWEAKSSFDQYFSLKSRFATGQILPLRLVTYGEAEFYDGPTLDEPVHNFDGLNLAEIKSVLSDGYVTCERKYEDMQTQRLSSFQILLTNHMPTIDQDHEALNRRILPLTILPSSMADKGRQLHLTSSNQIHQFLTEHQQAFANYFVDYFSHHQTEFTEQPYEHDQVANEIKELQSDHEQVVAQQLSAEQQADLKLKTLPIDQVIKTLGKQLQIADSTIETFIEQLAFENECIRYADHCLYLDSTKHFFSKYHLIGMRNRFLTIYGHPIKKFGKRMFRIKM